MSLDWIPMEKTITRKKWHNNKKFDKMELEIVENHTNRMDDSENFDNIWKLIGIRVAAETEQDGP